MKVKICGITNIDDAMVAAEAGADYLGFIVFPKSPRYVAPETIREITAQLPGTVKKVGVFVNPEPELVQEVIDHCGIDIVQLHGDESPEFASLYSRNKVWKAVHLTDAAQIDDFAAYPVSAFVVDSMVKGLRGGTGICCDWQLAAQAAARFDVMLAGGINADNAVEAVRAVSPYGLDVASGVEKSPGLKDHEKIRNLFNNLKKANII